MTSLRDELELIADETLLAELGVYDGAENDITKLVHVRPKHQRKSPIRIAKQIACTDFDTFKPIFLKVQRDLKFGILKTRKYQNNATINLDDLFLLNGLMVYVAALGKEFNHPDGRSDRRLRVIFYNGMECDILLRSMQRSLNKDKTSRRILPINKQ